MKKGILLILLLGLLVSCSGGAGQKNKASEETKTQIEAIDQSVKKLENTIDSAKAKIDTLQSEVDGILSEI